MRPLSLRIAPILLLTAATCVPAIADHALVVGVNTYPNLPTENQLEGSDNDAKAMGKKLTDTGFTVTVLTDAQATKTGILNALDKMKANTQPNERFVFYFAGHGAKSPANTGVILASDAVPSSQANCITKDELHDAIAAVPARSHTVLLDSCFSGAMSRALPMKKGLGHHLKARFYNYAMSKRIQLTSVNGNDNPQPANTTGDNVCYFVAANPYQCAYEDDFDGQRHGIFTHYLTGRISDKKEPWSNVQTDVTGGVIANTDGTQSPVLSASFASIPVFEGNTVTPGPTPTPTPTPGPTPPHRKSSIWDEFSEDHTDHSRLLLAVTPDQASVKIGDKFRFKVTMGISNGYLVVVELDTNGSVNLLYPTSRKAGDGRQSAGVLSLPESEDKAYTTDSVGAERIKAILFKTQDDAQNLLSAFPEDGTVASWRSAKDRKVVLTTSDATPFTTSVTGFEVLPKE